ncbi:peptidoglycan D,D-transpeptidase FtsI family protein [Roseiflexus castenholzii]|uniref:peptidoglycan D,D-transpeptidase FtsI family protein n=1 Tax=Roseiflexus castenholzii TaxID=120962 RepID=UPI00031332BE|nr:penicillin-binding protein 2 [Roseiflexus castenholzii]
MRSVLRLISLGAAAVLLIYGVLQPIDQDSRWMAALWIALPLLYVAARLSLPSASTGIARHVQHLALAMAIGFVALSLQLLRQQFVYADAIAGAVFVDQQTGQTTSNVRKVVAALKVQRGPVLDRNGTVIVATEVVEGGYAVRRYPLAAMYDPTAFGNVVGFFSSRFGQSGIEATYNDYLSGERDSWRRLQDTLLDRPRVGDTVRLTIDARLQAAAHAALGERIGSIVVLDPRTGAVLAMVSRPGFDPRGLAFNPAAPDRQAENRRIDEYWRAINAEGAGQPLLNRSTQGRYAPGSTFKTVTAVAVLLHPEQGRPDAIDCPDERPTEPGAPPVVNAVRTGLEGIIRSTPFPAEPNLERVYAFSCNTAFAEYAMRLGPDLLAETARRFDIDRPQEASNVYNGFTDLPTLPSLLYVNPGFLNSRAALADTGFGQGELQVTPLQMAMVAATIANDGMMMRPFLVAEIIRPDGTTVVRNGPRPIRRVMPVDVAARMRSNMRAAVAYGFGKAADAVPGVEVGGKSGTAEYPCPTSADPERLCAHAWFIAIAPVDQPRFAVVVMIENGGEGSRLGAEVAGQVLRSAFDVVR